MRFTGSYRVATRVHTARIYRVWRGFFLGGGRSLGLGLISAFFVVIFPRKRSFFGLRCLRKFSHARRDSVRTRESHTSILGKKIKVLRVSVNFVHSLNFSRESKYEIHGFVQSRDACEKISVNTVTQKMSVYDGKWRQKRLKLDLARASGRTVSAQKKSTPKSIDSCCVFTEKCDFSQK